MIRRLAGNKTGSVFSGSKAGTDYRDSMKYSYFCMGILCRTNSGMIISGKERMEI
jgi:hypothetical protein